MNIPKVLLSFAAVVCLSASCKESNRDFAPSAGASGAGTAGGAGKTQGGAGSSSSGGRGGGSTQGGAGGVATDGGAAPGEAGSGAAAGSVGEAGSGGEAGAGADCSAAARRCSADVPEVCSANGAWEPTQAGCAFGCLGGVCNECEEGVKACGASQAKTCVDGRWQFTSCDSQCEAGECVDTCTEGTRQCDGVSKIQLCTAGAFADETDCPSICAEGKCVGACKPDAMRCRPGSTTTPELCSSQGQWVAAACGGATSVCLDGACVACTPGATRCSMSGAPQQCSEFGSWVDEPPCAGNAPACVEGQCRTCDPGARRCNAGVPQTCNAGGTAWVDGTACSGATPACVAATGQCGTCRAGDRQCSSDTTPQACDANGRWVDEPKCGTASPVCLVGQCVACQPNDRRCNGSAPELCGANGQWASQAACAGSTPSCLPATGLCGCKEGAQECFDSNTPQVCSAAGAWVTQSDCRGDAPVCVGGACQCNEGDQECTSATTTRVCTNGVWEPLACPLEYPACAAGKCVECVPGATRCSAGGTHIVEVCSSDGVWKQSTQCADFCAKATCVTPATEPGILGCDGATGLLCKAPNCCFANKGTSYCEDPRVACGAKTIPMECDGPSDCPKATPICCAAPTGIGCVALAADCTRITGEYVCDPVDPSCPARTTCQRFTSNLFTCQ